MSKSFDKYLQRKLSDAKAHEVTPTTKEIALEDIKNKTYLILTYGIMINVGCLVLYLYSLFNKSSSSTNPNLGAFIFILQIAVIYIVLQIVATVYLIKNCNAIKENKLQTAKYKKLSIIGYLISWIPVAIFLILVGIGSLPK